MCALTQGHAPQSPVLGIKTPTCHVGRSSLLATASITGHTVIDGQGRPRGWVVPGGAGRAASPQLTRNELLLYVGLRSRTHGD